MLGLGGSGGRERQRDDFVPGQPGCGPAAGLGAAVPALPEPGLVGVLHHPAGEPVAQGVLVAFGEGVPPGVAELLHVLCAHFLGHHGSSGKTVKRKNKHANNDTKQDDFPETETTVSAPRPLIGQPYSDQ